MRKNLQQIVTVNRTNILAFILFLFIFNVGILKAEDDYILKLGFWKFTQFNGTIIGEDFYRNQTIILNNDFRLEEETNTILGKLRLNLKSYIWHPNLMQLDVEGEYSPDSRSEKYIVIPDRSESNTSKRINLYASFLNNTPVALNTHYSYSQTLTNRDYTNDIVNNSISYGVNLGLRSFLLPINLGYNVNNWSQTEITAQRVYSDQRKILSMSLSKEIGYSNNSVNANYELAKTHYSGSDTLNSKIFNANLSNSVYFDRDRNNTYNSFIMYNDINGYQRLKQFNANEQLKIQLPERFSLKANYQYSNQTIDTTKMIMHSPSLMLENQLYLSLRSYGFYQMNLMDKSTQKETQQIFGVGFNYKKLIPTGILWMNYEFRGLNESMENQQVAFRAQNEEYTIDDSKPLIINNPFIRPNTLLIRDANLSTNFLENIDYLLIPRGSYTEVKRIPGGRIVNGSKIYIDYYADYQSSYKYLSLTHAMDGRVSIFNNFVELYYRLLFSDYKNVEVQELKALRNINQKFAGVQFNYHSLSFGAEYDYYQTNVLPYESFNIFSRFTDNVTDRLMLSFNARYQYTDYVHDNSLQRTSDFMIMANYTLNSWSSALVNYHYLYQQGSGIDLISNNLRIEMSARVMQIVVTSGYEYYARNFMGEQRNFNSVFIRLERSF